jgi:hypothetical protein
VVWNVTSKNRLLSSGLECYVEKSITFQWSGKLRRKIDYFPVVWKVTPNNRLLSSGLERYAEIQLFSGDLKSEAEKSVTVRIVKLDAVWS